MAIKWDELLATGTIEDWSNALDEIVKEAEGAIKQENVAKKIELQDLLKKYIKLSPPVPALDTLDEIAKKTYDDLFIDIVGESIAAIASRNAELKKARDLIVGVTEQAKKDKKSIMLENVVDALDKSKMILETLKEFEETLDSSDQTLIGKIEAVKDAITELEAKIDDQG